MARSISLAGIMLVLLAGAHAAQPARRLLQDTDDFQLTLADDTGAQLDNGGLSEIPATVSTFDVTLLEPLLPLIPKINGEVLGAIGGIADKLNSTWLTELVPYMNAADPKKLGELLVTVAPTLDGIDPAVIGRYAEIMSQINGKSIEALVPALGTLNLGVVAKLVPSINAMDPNLVLGMANLAASLSPSAWDLLISAVNLGVPAINLLGYKLNLVPVSIAAPGPYQASSWRLPFFGHLGH